MAHPNAVSRCITDTLLAFWLVKLRNFIQMSNAIEFSQKKEDCRDIRMKLHFDKSYNKVSFISNFDLLTYFSPLSDDNFEKRNFHWSPINDVTQFSTLHRHAF